MRELFESLPQIILIVCILSELVDINHGIDKVGKHLGRIADVLERMQEEKDDIS